MLSNSVCNHTGDKQIGLPLRGRSILLSLLWYQTELDSTQSYYHYQSSKLDYLLISCSLVVTVCCPGIKSNCNTTRVVDSIVVKYKKVSKVKYSSKGKTTSVNFLQTILCYADLNPCLDVHCPSFGVCKTFSAHEARCVCYEDCPSYHDPVCTANGTTYDNKCWHELYYCRGLENNLVYHPGSCEGRQGFLLSWTMYMSVLIWFHKKRMAYRC